MTFGVSKCNSNCSLVIRSSSVISYNNIHKWAATWENRIFAYAKTKPQISCAVTAQLISAFVFATWIVQSLYFLYPKFRVSSYLLWLYSPVCVGPGRKPRRPVFWRRGSIGIRTAPCFQQCRQYAFFFYLKPFWARQKCRKWKHFFFFHCLANLQNRRIRYTTKKIKIKDKDKERIKFWESTNEIP